MNAILVLVSSLCITSVLPLKLFPFKVWELTNTSISMEVESRIYGGNEAAEGEFKFMILALMILPNDFISRCSTSLIKPDWVLLAAHCLTFRGLQGKDIILVGGKAKLADYVHERVRTNFNRTIDEQRLGVQERRAKEFFIHPKYNDQNHYHDVALIKLDEPFKMNTVATISLSSDEIKRKKECKILGWGFMRGNRQTYKLNFIENKKVITPKRGCIRKRKGPFICLKPDNRGICQGDSGSPLVCDDKVWGVASHFASAESKAECGDSIEEYYAELYPELNWIEMTMTGGGYKSAVTSFTTFWLVLFSLWSSGKT